MSGRKKPTFESLNECFSLDDITVFAFQKCLDAEFKHINKDAKERETDIENWEKVYDAFISKFGQSKQFESYCRLQKKLINFRLEFVISGDPSWLDQIMIIEKQLEAEKKSEGMTYTGALLVFSKILGYRLDPKKITLLEFKEIEENHGRIN